MSNEDSKLNKFILKSGDDVVAWCTLRFKLYERAKELGIESYIRPNSSILPDISILELDNRSNLDIYIEALKYEKKFQLLIYTWKKTASL